MFGCGVVSSSLGVAMFGPGVVILVVEWLCLVVILSHRVGIFSSGVILFGRGVAIFSHGVVMFGCGVAIFCRGVVMFGRGVAISCRGVAIFSRRVAILSHGVAIIHDGKLDFAEYVRNTENA